MGTESHLAVVEINPKDVWVPDTIKKTIDWKTEKNMVFEDSIRRKQINPINVRPLSSEQLQAQPKHKYELVCGFRRLSAIKHLGFDKITAKIEPWSDKEIGFIRCAENVHRVQLTAPQEAKANQELMRQFKSPSGRTPSGPLIAQSDSPWGRPIRLEKGR